MNLRILYNVAIKMQHMTPPNGFTFSVISSEKTAQLAEQMHIKYLRNAATQGFLLTKEQLIRFEHWDDEQNVTIRASNGGVLSVGACGGQVTFEFTPTGMGMVVKAKNTLTNTSIDLTEYE